MRAFIAVAIATMSLLLSGCPAKEAVKPRAAETRWVTTELDAGSCRKEADKEDPNETPYLVCPGVGGYTLHVRRVDSGRRSIDVVNPEGKSFPLNYQEFVTRHMFTLDKKTEWYVETKDGKEVASALIVRVQAREDNRNPGKVTSTYIALAKIKADAACVTDSIREATQTEAEVRALAESAPQRPCAQPLPPMRVDGTNIR